MIGNIFAVIVIVAVIFSCASQNSDTNKEPKTWEDRCLSSYDGKHEKVWEHIESEIRNSSMYRTNKEMSHIDTSYVKRNEIGDVLIIQDFQYGDDRFISTVSTNDDCSVNEVLSTIQQ